MAGNSRFLPGSVADALRSLLKRFVGAVVLAVALWALGVLVFFNPYLDGFGVASTFGSHSVMGWCVGALRYAIGTIPGIFVLLCVARWGAARLIGLDCGATPEYNFLRGFIAVCLGATGFGLVSQKAVYGGLFGAIAAMDLAQLLGAMAPIVGILCMVAFFWMGGVILHVRWAHVKAAIRMFVRWLRWVGAAFHLVSPRSAGAVQDVRDGDFAVVESSDVEAEDVAPDEPVQEKPKRGLLGRRIQKVQNAPKAAAVVPVVAPKRVRAVSSGYQLPDPRLLEKSAAAKYVVTPELKQNARAMETHFAEYGVEGRVVAIKPGPVVTLYEFEPAPGQKIVDIEKTNRDMTRAMAVEKFRISQLPKSNYLGVEVANLERQMVRYRSLMEDDLFVNSKYKIPLALGVNIGGNPMYFDLAKMPHMLIAGRTGSGKSVFVQSIITSIVYHFTPDKCKLMIVDPKGVDFVFWDNIPHLITPIVKADPQAAINALKWAVREMEERFKQLRVLNARNIESYNEIVAQKRAAGEKVTNQVPVGTDPETGELIFETQEVDLSDMPFLVIIIDEVADLMAVARKEVELSVQRIAQKARAAGIHLIMATQRPDATIITGVIKANFPTRVSFQAASRIDSMTTLGATGAEQLLAMGDMLFSEGGHPAVRIHGAYISDEELNKIGDHWRSQGEPEYAEGVTDGDDSGGFPGMPGAISGGGAGGKGGDLYEQAKEIVIRDKKPTISYLQRRLGIGYNKAAGLIERMEQDGILSEPDANNKRHIIAG
ncbi:MAG: DUF87 domain-containing protein [Alphaproteobacteria bacterium]|nr:DUF87 domain-containing protein [Alphaproteobacteria bacterium]